MPRNVLIITADQWRADSLGAAGHPMVRTPAIDALATEATRFRRHFTVTSPCAPSRASLWTGMYAHNHRVLVNGTPLDYSFTNLAMEVRKSGIDPMLYGYTDTTPDPRVLPSYDPAFLTYENVLPGMTAAVHLRQDNIPWLSYLEAQGYAIPGPGYAIYHPGRDAGPPPPGRGITHAPARYRAEHSDTTFLTDQCIAGLRRHREAFPDRPFFVHLSLLRPHPPWIAPEPYHALYDPADVPAPRRAASREAEAGMHPALRYLLETTPQSAYFEHGQGLAADLDEADVRQLRATYYGLITEVDHHIGRLVQTLRTLGVYDDTLIVLTSDHGEQLGDHHLLGKRGWFDASVRIPLILRDPHRPDSHGRTVDAMTESVDLMPTVLVWLGEEVPAQCDGHSLMPLVRGETPAGWRTAVHWSFDFREPTTFAAETFFGLASRRLGMLVHREACHKYVHFAALPPLLYDLANDPDETRNLAMDPDARAVLSELRVKLLSWRMEHEYDALTNRQFGQT